MKHHVFLITLLATNITTFAGGKSSKNSVLSSINIAPDVHERIYKSRDIKDPHLELREWTQEQILKVFAGKSFENVKQVLQTYDNYLDREAKNPSKFNLEFNDSDSEEEFSIATAITQLGAEKMRLDILKILLEEDHPELYNQLVQTKKP